MTGRPVSLLDVELDGFIAAFEAARCQGDQADLEAFLPPHDHARYRDVLRELVRVDLEWNWAEGRPTPLEDYRGRFPDLFADPGDLRDIAFEEYRVRRQAGEDPDPKEYARRYGVDLANGSADRSQGRSSALVGTQRVAVAPVTPAQVSEPTSVSGSPRSVSRPANNPLGSSWVIGGAGPSQPPPSPPTGEATGLPAIGSEFLGFRIVGVLGQGAFGRVYLARQGDLSDRPVVLKVAHDARGESQVLARLQHTNIVPVHSYHRAGRFHAICMPFLGPTTLDHLLDEMRTGGPLPASARALIDTFNVCRSRTRGLSSGSGIGSDTGAPPPESGSGLGAMAEPQTASNPPPALHEVEGRSYAEVVLWIGARLAAGLAHAHDRGILHLDIKPANVLLADDGQPMLLDFNLCRDTAIPQGSIGGTITFMSPEHLLAFQHRSGTVDGRSDVYSLGVLLFEMLTGQQPFPIPPGPLRRVVPTLVDARLQPPPRLRDLNPSVSPAAEAIVRKCLDPDPRRRYQSARDLQEDLDRHLQHLPLRHAREPSLRERAQKWARRHPRLFSASAVGTLAGVLLLGLGGLLSARSEQLARVQAAASYDQFEQEVREAQVSFLDASLGQAPPAAVAAACRRPLDRYHVLEGPNWETRSAARRLPDESRERLRGEIGELLFLLALAHRLQADVEPDPTARRAQYDQAIDWARRAEVCYAPAIVPAPIWLERADLATRLGRPEAAAEARQRASQTPVRTTRDRGMAACELMAQGWFRQALPLWERATLDDPHNVWMWYGLGFCYDQLDRPADAAASYSACIAIDPTYHRWYFKRGLDRLRRNDPAGACLDFDRAIELNPRFADAFINRGLARLGDHKPAEAAADFSRALELGAIDPRVFLMRARARDQVGDPAGATQDRAEALAREPIDETGWLARGYTRVSTDPRGALADFESAVRANPRSLPALENQAHVLSERLGRTPDAVAALDRAVAFYPEDGRIRAVRGVLLARLGKRSAAMEDAQTALQIDGSAPVRYRVAGIYALGSGDHPDDRARATDLLADALRQGVGHDWLGTDPDLLPLRGDPEFQRLLGAVRVLGRKPGAGGAREGTVP